MASPLWPQRVRLQQLRIVMAVQEHASLLKAAEALGLTQPAVSKALQDLEQDLGVKLFRRTNRGTETTPYGDAMIRHLRAVFSQLNRAADELTELREGGGGHVAVGTLVSASARLLPLAIARLHREKRRIGITVLEGTYDLLTPALVRGELDFIVGRLPEFFYRQGLEVESLFDEVITFVVRPDHPLAHRGQHSLAGLLDWPWVLPPRETTLRRLFDKAFRDRNLEPPAPACESISLLANRRLLADTDMIGVWPGQVAQDDIADGRLVALDIGGDIAFGPVGISRRRGKPLSPAAEALVESLRQVAQPI